MDRLVSMVKAVAAGVMRVPPGVGRVFVKIRAGATPEESELTYAPGRLNGLRRRFRRDAKEWEILASFSRGMSYAAIAEARRVKPVTIRNAIYAIQGTLGLGSK